MSPGATYALITFVAGVIALLGWLYANAANPQARNLLGKSVGIFAVPIVFMPGEWVLLHVGMWAAVAIEEALKAVASRSEKSPTNRFWLVALFGIWELMLDKPWWGFRLADQVASWGRLEIIGLVIGTVLPVLVHTVTAAIYAFAFQGRLWAAFLTAWFVHLIFNATVAYFGPSGSAVMMEAVVLAGVLAGLLMKRTRQIANEAA